MGNGSPGNPGRQEVIQRVFMPREDAFKLSKEFSLVADPLNLAWYGIAGLAEMWAGEGYGDKAIVIHHGRKGGWYLQFEKVSGRDGIIYNLIVLRTEKKGWLNVRSFYRVKPDGQLQHMFTILTSGTDKVAIAPEGEGVTQLAKNLDIPLTTPESVRDKVEEYLGEAAQLLQEYFSTNSAGGDGSSLEVELIEPFSPSIL